MFKKILIYFLIFIIGLIALYGKVNADFNESYQGYLKTYEFYRSTRSDYITTRNQYLQYGTLNSKTEALNAGKKFVTARDDTLLSYISLLKERNQVDEFNLILTDLGKFVDEHKPKVDAVASLDDLVNVSQDAERQNLQFQLISKKITATLNLSKVINYQSRFTLLDGHTQQMITTLKNDNKDVSVLERWNLDAKNKELLAQQKISEIQNLIDQMDNNSQDKLDSDYNKIQMTILEANQYIREAIQFMTELSNLIKYGKY